MHESKKQVGVALAPLLKQNGYLKRALSWHKHCSDTILVFHAEKNRWGADDYSFHLGIYLPALGDENTPPHYRCPVQTTLDRLVPNDSEIHRISNFADSSLDFPTRLRAISELVESYALPWLEEYSSLSALSQLALSDYERLLPRILMFRVAYDFLRTQKAV
jgi:hypothetical protein